MGEQNNAEFLTFASEFRIIRYSYEIVLFF